MSDDGASLAKTVSGETPWWATAPIWLAAGIVGVPSLIAIGAGYFVAQHVTTALRELSQFSQSQLYLINEHINFTNRNYEIVVKFMDDDLRCQYVTCLNSAQTPEQRKACVSPAEREREYGLTFPKKRSPSTAP